MHEACVKWWNCLAIFIYISVAGVFFKQAGKGWVTVNSGFIIYSGWMRKMATKRVSGRLHFSLAEEELP